jgi:hypothetical protein
MANFMTPEKPSLAQALLDSLSNEPGMQHELTFYATFAHKTFLLMQREGPKAEGFAKLQQSFQDTVEKVRAIIQKSLENGYSGADALLEVSPSGMAKLMDLMHDLTRIKQSKL